MAQHKLFYADIYTHAMRTVVLSRLFHTAITSNMLNIVVGFFLLFFKRWMYDFTTQLD